MAEQNANAVAINGGTISVTGAGLTLQDATDNTKRANFVLSGLTTGTTYAYTLPAVTGAALATLGNISQTFAGFTVLNNGANVNGTFSWASATGTYTVGTSAATGTITLGQATGSQTVNISNAATASGSTNTINMGTGGLAGSNTIINIGNIYGTTTTVRSSFSLFGQFAINNITSNVSISPAQGTGLITIGGTSAATGTITLGQSTVSQQTDIQAGATASGSTKTLNIGTGGLTGSTTTIAIGGTAGTSTITLNGLTKQQTYTVATLPTGSAGARSFVTNALTPAFGAAVTGGGAVGIPVYHDGTSWKVG
jgi:hypothetical protein